jgi:hypothetical protein
VNINRGEVNESKKWIDRVLRSGKFRTLEQKQRNQWKLIQMYLYIISGNFDEVKVSSIKHSLGYKSVIKSNQNVSFLIGEIYNNSFSFSLVGLNHLLAKNCLIDIFFA